MVDTTTAGVIRFAEDLMMTARTAQASANTCLKFDVASQVLVALVKERDEAVTEIARLTAAQERIEALEGALTRMIEWAEGPGDRFGPMIRQARAALDGKIKLLKEPE